MKNMVNIRPRYAIDTKVVSLSLVEQALWQLGLTILDPDKVARHRKHARFTMLWRTMRWLILGLVGLVALECLGRNWRAVGLIAGAAVMLAALFSWLVYASDLRWTEIGYDEYRNLYAVPSHVAAAADQLLRNGVSASQIRVEYLKDDPILFVEEIGFPSKRYDLIIW